MDGCAAPSETDTGPKLAQANERWSKHPGDLGLGHLAACLAVGGAATFVADAIGFLAVLVP
jgi:hypothetical protein